MSCPQNVQGANLGLCEVFDEPQLRALICATLGESRVDEAATMLVRELLIPGGGHSVSRDHLLSTLGRVPPRQRFRALLPHTTLTVSGTIS